MSAFDAYVQAAFHGDTMPGGPTFTVLHDAETPLELGYCDAIVEFFRKGPKAGTSAHAMVGPEKAVKLLPDDVVAWAAGPKANPRGWHLEQTGYARFTRAQWLTDRGRQQVGRVAGCLREVHDQWGIPKRWMTDDQLRAAANGDRSSGGMTTHQQVARVLRGTDHTDPEENYPRDLLLQALLGTPTTQEDDMFELGDAQRLTRVENAVGLLISVAERPLQVEARLTPKLDALTAVVQQLATKAGTPIDMAAVEAAVEKGVADAIASIETTVSLKAPGARDGNPATGPVS